MMNKMIVAVFGNETDVYNGLTGLEGLHVQGAITLYKQIVIEKDDAGEVLVKDVDSSGPIGTALGITLGSMVGLLGGPAAAIVAASGASIAGMTYDIQNAGVDAEFIDDVAEALVPGTFAILADIEEEWTTPLDTQMTESNGVVFRKSRLEVEDEQIQREIDLTKEDMKRYKAEFKASLDNTKENIQKHIDSAKKKLNALADRSKAKMEKLKEEMKEKSETLKAQLKEANEENKAKINDMLEKLEAGYDAQIEKYNRAYEAAVAELEKED